MIDVDTEIAWQIIQAWAELHAGPRAATRRLNEEPAGTLEPVPAGATDGT